MQMERVGLGSAPAAGRKAAKSADAGTGNFAQLVDAPAEGEAAAEAPVTGAAMAAAPLGGLMSYETALDRVQADRQARRHGRAMLRALGALHVSLLTGDRAAAQALADLAAQVPEADDPVLRLILREIGVRAAVELARQDEPANISTG